jgi:hypothetical protein
MEPVTVRSSRRKYVRLLLGSVGFFALAALLPGAGTDVDWRWPARIFFGLGTLVFAALLIRPQRLSLDSSGLTVSGGLVLKPRSIGWAEIDRFIPLQPGMIGFTYRPRARPESHLRRFNRRMSNVDDAIPGRWELSTPDMIALLEDYRSRALSEPAERHRISAPHSTAE